MTGQWYCQIGGQQAGPLSTEQLRQFAEQRRIGPDNLVRSGRDGNWMPARRVSGLFDGLSSAAPAGASAVAVKSPSSVGSAPRRALPSNGGSPSGRVPPPVASRPMPAAPAATASKLPPLPAAHMAGPTGANSGAVHSAYAPQPRTGGAGRIIAIVLISVFGVFVLVCGGVAGMGYMFVSRIAAERERLAAAAREEIDRERRAYDAQLQAQLQADLEASQTPEQRIAGQVMKWHNARNRVRSGTVQFEVASVQVLPSRGQLVDPPGAGVLGGGPVVLIEVSVVNLAAAPLDFKSWSRGGRVSENLRAVLIDGEGNTCPAVTELGAAESLLAEDTQLESRKAVSDLLVFEAPPSSAVSYVRLALPYAAIGREGYIGFEIPGDMLAPGSAGGAPSGEGGATFPGTPGAGDPPLAPQPETIDDLKKAIEASRNRK